MIAKMPLLLLLLFVLSSPAVGEAKRLGIILPLTGKGAAAGEAVRNGAVMANDSLGHPFELIFEDNGLDNARTAAIVGRLVDMHSVDALIVYGSGPANSAAPLAERAQVPMIGLSVDPNVSRSRNWVMIHWAPNRHLAERLVAELAFRRLKRVAIVTAQVQGLLDLEVDFSDRAKANGLEVVYSQQHLPGEADFQATISRLRGLKPDAVFINLYFGQAGNFARQCTSLRFSPQLFGQFVLDDEAEVAASQGALEGAFFASTAVGDPHFEETYWVRFQKRPVLGGIGAYDAVSLLAAAFTASSDKDDAMQYLHTLRNFPGKIGVYGSLPDNSFDVPAGLGIIREGRIQRVVRN